MKLFYKYIALIFLVGLAQYVCAQDAMFSQNDLTPLHINPALSGLQKDVSLNAGYRTQWGRTGESFETAIASVDVALKPKKKSNKSYLGVGMNFYNDIAGVPKTRNTAAHLNIAYHLFFNERSSLSVALNGGYHGVSVNYNDGKWGSQFDGWEHNPTLPSGENIIDGARANIDVGTGVVYSFRRENQKEINGNIPIFQAGLAFYHVNRPNLSIHSESDYALPMRFSSFLTANVGIGNKFLVSPGIYIHAQNKFNQVLFGANIRYTLIESLKSTSLVSQVNTAYFSLGLFYRSSDAVIMRCLLEYTNYAFGIAFDVTTSNLQSTVQSRGATELVIRYSIASKKMKAFY